MEHYKIFKLWNDLTVSKFVTKKWIEINDLSSRQYSEGDNDDKTRNKKLNFKNNAPFRSCISKINNTFIYNAEDLDIVMLICNLLEYSGNYSMASGSFWDYYRDEVDDDENEINNANNKINSSKTITSKSVEYKTKIKRRTPAGNNTLDAEIVVPLRSQETLKSSHLFFCILLGPLLVMHTKNFNVFEQVIMT